MVRKEILAVLLFLVGLVSARTTYDGSQLLSVTYQDQHMLRSYVRNERMDIWSQNQTNTEFLVPRHKLESVKKYLEEKNIPYTVLIRNVQELIDEEKVSRPRIEKSIFSLNQYNTLNEIYEWMDGLSEKYPKLVSVETIGYTYENRTMRVAKISSGNPGAKAVFIDGGIHAREWISITTVIYILNELVENRSTLPSFMADLDFYILPVFNPDGYVYTHTTDRLWRKNLSKNPGPCLGTDLNRNFDAHFGGVGTSGYSCDEIYRGPYAFSEPETKAFSEYMLKIRKNVITYIAFHSFSQAILLPHGYGFQAYPTDYRELQVIGINAASAIRRMGGESYKVGTPADVLYPAAGGAYDWVKETAGVKYSYTYELRDKGNYGFVLPTRFIRPTAKEAFEGVKIMVEAATKSK